MPILLVGQVLFAIILFIKIKGKLSTKEKVTNVFKMT